MIYANGAITGKRIKASLSGDRALCPHGHEVVAKCGDINAYHWAHVKGEDCDSFSEPETKWHIDWKEIYPPRCREVVVGNHRADVKINNRVIEFQHSSIDQESIIERESFYGNMIWVIDAREFNLDFTEKEEHLSFRWKWARKSWRGSTKDIYFDTGDKYRLFKVGKIHWFSVMKFGDGRVVTPKKAIYGWGNWVDMNTFLYG